MHPLNLRRLFLRIALAAAPLPTLAPLGCSGSSEEPEAAGGMDDAAQGGLAGSPQGGAPALGGNMGMGGGGRRPAGLVDVQHSAPSALGAYFAELCHLEAASVPAFRNLGRELGAHGAPASLVRATRVAAREEIQHARLLRALTERHGGRYQPPRVRSRRVPGLQVIARENEVEGCVRETYAALVATYQAAHAGDPELRRTFALIARDETRHAALSLRIARWASPRLAASERSQLLRARRRTITELRRSLALPVAAELTRVAGLPPRAVALRLLAGLERELWT